jgi:ubiquinone/menaquinone biosynthesis C-methylase UbiE
MKQLKHLFIAIFCSLVFFTACDTGSNDIPKEKQKQVEVPAKVQERGDSGITENYGEYREIWQKPELVLQFLGGLEGKVVADIGAGEGFFTFKLIEDAAEKVIAIDVDAYYTHYLDSIKVRRLPAHLQDKLETRLTTPDKSGLKDGEVDVVVIVNTFMYIENHDKYLKTLKDGIKDGGKLLIIDFKKKRTKLGPPSALREPLFQVEDELYKAGYKNIVTNDYALDYQYIVIAEK